jgi:hypothetical protein
MQEHVERPLLQMVVFIVLSVVTIPVVKPKNADLVWTIAGAIYAVFIVVNSVLICLVSKVWPYFFSSMLCSFVYLLVAGLAIPTYISITKTVGSNESGMVFIMAMYHPLASLLVIFLKWTYQKVF